MSVLGFGVRGPEIGFCIASTTYSRTRGPKLAESWILVDIRHGLMDYNTLLDQLRTLKFVNRRLMGNTATSDFSLRIQLIFDSSASRHKVHNASQRQHRVVYRKQLFCVMCVSPCRSPNTTTLFVWPGRGGGPFSVWIVEEAAVEVCCRW